MKNLINYELDERSRSFAFTRKKRLFPKSAIKSNPKRFKYYDKKRVDIIENDGSYGGRDLVVVDIQPEYMSGINFLPSFINFINENYIEFNRIIFLYNGYDTLGMINESDYIMWWLENGLDEEVIDHITFYDKGYAFFRYCIDEGIEDESIVNLVKHMIDNGVNDSRDLGDDFWNEFIELYGDEDIRELLEYADDMINIPDLMDVLERYNNIILCGGGINECLKEVELSLDVLDKNYSILDKFTY